MPDDPNNALSRAPKSPGKASSLPGDRSGPKSAEDAATPASPGRSAGSDESEHADHATEEAAA